MIDLGRQSAIYDYAWIAVVGLLVVGVVALRRHRARRRRESGADGEGGLP